MNLQDAFLAQLRKDKSEIVIYLVNGFQLKGLITGFDNFTIFIENSDGKPQMVYKHAVTTVHPIKPVTLEFMDEILHSSPRKKVDE